jgi:hypothetical protein
MAEGVYEELDRAWLAVDAGARLELLIERGTSWDSLAMDGERYGCV